MTRRPVAPAPDPDAPGRPYERLVPLVEALVAAGNRLRYENGDRGFIPQPDGYNCFLAEPIDFDLLRSTFELPDDLRLRPEKDTVVDAVTYCSIHGAGAFPPKESG